MGVATSIAIIGGVAAAAQAVDGASKASAAKNALNNLKAPELINPYENMQVDTKESDIQREEAAQYGANAVGALQESGVRGIVGGVAQVSAEDKKMNRQIAADQEKQAREIKMASAKQQINNADILEQRHTRDVAALSSQVTAGNNQMWTGINGVAQAGISGVIAYGEKKK